MKNIKKKKKKKYDVVVMKSYILLSLSPFLFPYLASVMRIIFIRRPTRKPYEVSAREGSHPKMADGACNQHRTPAAICGTRAIRYIHCAGVFHLQYIYVHYVGIYITYKPTLDRVTPFAPSKMAVAYIFHHRHNCGETKFPFTFIYTLHFFFYIYLFFFIFRDYRSHEFFSRSLIHNAFIFPLFRFDKNTYMYIYV